MEAGQWGKANPRASSCFWSSSCTAHLKLPVRSEALGLSKVWVTKFAPRLNTRRKREWSKERRCRGSSRLHRLASTWLASCGDPIHTRPRYLGNECQTQGHNRLPSVSWSGRENVKIHVVLESVVVLRSNIRNRTQKSFFMGCSSMLDVNNSKV